MNIYIYIYIYSYLSVKEPETIYIQVKYAIFNSMTKVVQLNRS